MGYLDVAIQAAGTSEIRNGTDYVGKDGFIHCGKCNEPKQMRLPFQKVLIVPCMCSCAAAEYNEKQRQELERIRLDAIERERYLAFGNSDFRHATIADDDGKNALLSRLCRKYVEKFPENVPWFVLYGGTGVGKSYAAAAIVNALIDKEYSARFVTLSQVEHALWDADKKAGVYDDLALCDILVIDDLGAERSTDYMSEIMYNVINMRLLSNLPMIVTTNFTQDELLSPADARMRRIMSRIFEKAVPVLCKGEDRRLQSMKTNARSIMEDFLNG